MPQEYGKCVDKKPVTCDYGDIFKANAQAKAKSATETVDRIIAGSQGKTLLAGYTS